ARFMGPIFYRAANSVEERRIQVMNLRHVNVAGATRDRPSAPSGSAPGRVTRPAQAPEFRSDDMVKWLVPRQFLLSAAGLALSAVAATAGAESRDKGYPDFEITPFYGYMAGGEFEDPATN